MAISEKATEFAGFPVIEYSPAMGLLLPTMPRREFRHGIGGIAKFWAITLEGNRLTVQAGKAGTSGEADTQTFPTAAGAQSDYGKKIASILREGYAEVKQAAGSTREAILSALAADPDDRVSRMALADHLEEQGEELPAVAYRVDSPAYEDEGWGTVTNLLAFLNEPAVSLVQALVVGACWGLTDGTNSAQVVESLIAARERLKTLRALFLGDILFDEFEISWIKHTNISGLFDSFPDLEHFRARGGDGLAVRVFRHEKLKSLAFEASNLSREVVLAVGASDLPALEHLELWLGTDQYGADTTPADLGGVLQGDCLPSLRYLGLRNSEIADDLPAVLAGAPVMDRLRVLDLSLGTLTDRGAEALLEIPGLYRLEKLDLRHNYISPAMVERLNALGTHVDAGDMREAEEPDDPYWRYVAHSE